MDANSRRRDRLHPCRSVRPTTKVPRGNDSNGPLPAAAPAVQPRAPILDTAYDLLYKFGGEASGYGLYSYVILLGSSDRDSAFIETMIKSTPAAQGLQWPHDQINLLLLPTVKVAQSDRASCGTGSQKICIQTPLGDSAAYDYNAARSLLYQLCENPTKAMHDFCNSAFGQGPILFTYGHPVSSLKSVPPPFLFVDLSSVEKGAFTEYLAAYKEQVKSEDITDGRKINTLRLKLLSLILSGSGLIRPVDEAIAGILHGSDDGGKDK